MEAKYWYEIGDDRVKCDLCPRACVLALHQFGPCHVRGNEGGRMITRADGAVSALAVDPMEKKPFYHVLPGASILSVGGYGCQLKCVFCQNWDLSHPSPRTSPRLHVEPKDLPLLAFQERCPAVAFTYNEPLVAPEFLGEASLACQQAGLLVAVVTSGFLCAKPRADLFSRINAANVDLKAFTEAFYQKQCGAHLEPVKETLLHIRYHTSTWLEITTLVIPGLNDTESEIRSLASWIGDSLGSDTPLHLSAFHPAGELHRLPPTPPSVIQTARKWAQDEGLTHVYTGNIRDDEGASTYCTTCQSILISRTGFTSRRTGIDPLGRCTTCGSPCQGIFTFPALQ